MLRWGLIHMSWRCILQQTENLCDSRRLEVTERRHLSADNDWWVSRKSGRPYAVDFASEELGKMIGWQLVWGALSWWLEQRVNRPPQGSWIASARVYGWQPELCAFRLVQLTLHVELLTPGCLQLNGAKSTVPSLQFPSVDCVTLWFKTPF